jgi:SAM-dependent methyltransferase
MADEVTRHYKSLLASHYTWMFGVPPATKVAEQKQLLTYLLAGEFPYSGLALDLGSGPGFQTLALADLGFAPVIALDTSETLLQELQLNQGAREITTIRADLRDLSRHVTAGEAGVIVCMADTLPHLPDLDSVNRLCQDVHHTLAPGGSFVLTFRDLSAGLDGLDRFIPVQSSFDRIMTCFLEFGTDFITVHDLIHIREDSGWRLLKSSYRKLRLSVSKVETALLKAGFQIAVSEPSGRFHAIVAKR